MTIKTAIRPGLSTTLSGAIPGENAKMAPKTIFSQRSYWPLDIGAHFAGN
jgi:hypothetical protein